MIQWSAKRKFRVYSGEIGLSVKYYSEDPLQSPPVSAADQLTLTPVESLMSIATLEVRVPVTFGAVLVYEEVLGEGCMDLPF